MRDDLEPWHATLDRFANHLIAFIACILFLLLVAFGIGLWTAAAETVEQWIHRVHPNCCDHRDCFPVQAWRGAGGWMVLWHGVERPFLGQPLPSPGVTVACGTQAHIRCLFLSGGVS